MSEPAVNFSENMLRREADAARNMLTAIATDDDQLIHDMIEGETGFLEACEMAIGEIRECEITIDGCQAEIDRLKARLDRAKKRKENVRAAIEQAMIVTDQKTITLPTKTLTIAYRKGVAVITNEAEIPAEFWIEQPPKLDKKKLNDAIADGVPGAHQANGTVSLTIRSA